MIASLVFCMSMLEADASQVCHGRHAARAGFFHLRARATQRTTFAAPACPQFAQPSQVVPVPMAPPAVAPMPPKAAAPDLEPRVAALEEKVQDAGRALLFNPPTAAAPPAGRVGYATSVVVAAPVYRAPVVSTTVRTRTFSRSSCGNVGIVRAIVGLPFGGAYR